MISKEEIKRLRKLHSAKGREETGLFLAEGEKSVAELQLSGLEVKAVYFVKGYMPATMRKSLVFVEVNEAEMGRISQFSSPSPVAAVGVIPQKQPITGNRLLYLDRITDPGNAGTIVRLCHWFGVDAVLMGEGSVECWNPKMVQASMGSVFNTNVVQHITLPDLKVLAEQGYAIVGTHLKGNDIREWKPVARTIVIMGNESQGMSAEIEQLCSSLVRIPGNGSAESINVAAASAIVLYEWNNKNK
ncbi:MAG: TrmH family RNA methyltransferase [Flavobacteriales bacterium]